MSKTEIKRKMFKFVVTDQFMSQLDEICERRGKTKSEMIRLAVEHFYFTKFRKEEYGYVGAQSKNEGKEDVGDQATPAVPAKKRSVNAVVDDMMREFVNMDLVEQTAFIHEVEYITEKMSEEREFSIRYMSGAPGTKCLFYSYRNSPGTTTEMPFVGINATGLLSDLRAHLREREKTRRLNAGEL